MLKIVKRTLAIVLALAMAFAVVGCGKKGDDDDNKAATGGGLTGVEIEKFAIDSEAVLASMPAELKNTKIVFLNWYNPDDREEKPVVAAFEEKTGIDVEYRVTDYNTYVQEVAKMLATKEQLDVMRMRNPEMAALKLLQPISVTGYDFSDKAWDKYTMGLYTVGDNCYAAALRYTPYFLPTLYFYNKDTIADMGFEDPYELWKQGKWTWSKMKEMCTTWVNENGTDYVGACVWGNPTDTVGASLVKLKDDGVTYDLDFTNQLALDCWKFLEEGKQMGIFNNLNDGFDQAKQKLLFGAMDASAVQQSSDYFNKTRMRGQLMTVAPPIWDGTEGYGAEQYTLPMMENIGFGVPKTAKNAKAVPYFLAYLCNLANYNTGVGEGGMFFSEQVKDAYMQLMTLEKRSYDATNAVATYDGTIGDFAWQLFHTVDPTQINSWLQEREYIVRTSMEIYNQDRLALK